MLFFLKSVVDDLNRFITRKLRSYLDFPRASRPSKSVQSSQTKAVSIVSKLEKVLGRTVFAAFGDLNRTFLARCAATKWADGSTGREFKAPFSDIVLPTLQKREGTVSVSEVREDGIALLTVLRYRKI